MSNSVLYAFLSLVLLYQEILLRLLNCRFLRVNACHGRELLLAPFKDLLEGTWVVYDVVYNPQCALDVAVLLPQVLLIRMVLLSL